MTFETSNTKWIEKLSDEGLLMNIREAMGAGCVHPCHVYDQVDELICRFETLKKNLKNG